ncbi:alpha/beta fold hydrolase [Haliea sp.]|jgi:esterase|uniref:alpha/beta fold hydrolase n=1 Tax=Haliea TaxID=475794 RepID=UPI000C59B7C5|nr:alpha/beta fold hydrolase [Haliea sp.]HAN67704.1 esterase [Halieaceae bacterium]MAD64876.1 esterase [Haliea sp.]MAY94675.1 esterase [Haliea sp.]MBP71679.1 esterase [Haliea sp.]HCD54778.1 esterase [Halieaceae bacterium]|tara:strand:- start:859 stop:1629 length:771 start_codon:yes stop_codon:yes gene_type:complete
MAAEVFDSVAGEGPDVVLLHGLFGMGSNLGGVSRALQDHYRVHSLDLPNHGRSGWTTRMSLPDMAQAVQRWMEHRHLETAHFVGHSLGGKVAMQLALDTPYRVDALVVADIAPVAYPPSHQAVFAAITAVAEADCESRSEAAQVMAQHLKEENVIQFLLLSLQRDAAGIYRWRFNHPVLQAQYDALLAAPEPVAPFDGRTCFIRGELSDYVHDDYRPQIAALFPQADIVTLAGCGHWLHAEQPARFNQQVVAFLDG